MITSNPGRTAERITNLEAYVRRNLLAAERFICRHHRDCRGSASPYFYEGQMSHVGKHYDLLVDGQELRIVVVGQEYGQKCTRVNLVARTAMIDGSASEGFQGRNPHMRGTTSILRLLLGGEPGTDVEEERLFGDGAASAHIFDGFALVNALLCSAVDKPPEGCRAGRGASSPLMRRNCARHFLRTLEILEPTIIVAEGQGVRSWIGGPLGLGPEPPACYKGAAIPEIARIDGKQVDILTFIHPSAPGKPAWWGNSVNSRYLKDFVEPTIARWRNRWMRSH
ncbi:MAG: hypothetical protein OXI39_06520 [Gemmatimonadota bacterium]|uniref:hypothetical protein n=1 Tax=Candidatus Palauibacter scopulicola TaxID=3056741 RepID=UPI002394FCCE|nr:hypothetical protein [Candidatus Palauibacter scopulicola]MDE2662643.1 hypothetical protein [Candidatus Palauibacter scopulicola]